MIRVVPDTNILISSIFWMGKPYEVIRGGIEGKHTLVTSREILEEMTERLKRAMKNLLFAVLIGRCWWQAARSNLTYRRRPRTR